MAERKRFVFFDAIAILEDGVINDVGGYYASPLFKMRDDQLTVLTLLGAHLQTLPTADGPVARFTAPQGLDLNVREFLIPLDHRRVSLLVGGQLIPFL